MTNEMVLKMAVELDVTIKDVMHKRIPKKEFGMVRDDWNMDVVPYLQKNQDNKELLSSLEELGLEYLFYQ